MTLPPQKRKRGRPPKQRIFSDTDTADGDSSASMELSEDNSVTKKRRRCNKDDECSFGLSPSEYLLLDYEIAPLGLTRQASKELALVSLRRKQECESSVSSKSEGGMATEGPLSLETKQDDVVKSKPSGTSNFKTGSNSSEEDDFEVIEISSQSTEDEEQQTSLKDSEPVVKEYIVISSQSESEGEWEMSWKKSTQHSSKTKLKKKTKKPGKSLIEDTGSDKSEKVKDSVELKEGFNKLNKTSVKDQSKNSNQRSDVDAFPPIDFSSESKAAATEVVSDKESSLSSKKSPEAFQIEKTKVFNEHATDENSNQVSSAGNFSFSKIQSLLKKSTKEKNPIPGILDNSAKSDSEQKSTDLSRTTNSADIMVVSSMSIKNSSGPTSPVSSKQLQANESSVNRKENNDMENLVTRTPLDMDTSQFCTDVDVAGTTKRKNEKSAKGRARRTEGRPKSIREIKRKRLSIDTSAGIQENLAVSTKSAISENSTGGMNEALGKPEKQMIASTTADLLPMQNKTSSALLMDGDLIGAIIQDSGKIDENKSKPQTAISATKKDTKTQENENTQNKAQDKTEKFKPWVSFCVETQSILFLVISFFFLFS